MSRESSLHLYCFHRSYKKADLSTVEKVVCTVLECPKRSQMTSSDDFPSVRKETYSCR